MGRAVVKLWLAHGNRPQEAPAPPLEDQVREYMRACVEWEEASAAFEAETAAILREHAEAEAAQRARRERPMTYESRFTFTIGDTAVARPLERTEAGRWEATVGDSIREEGATREEAIRKAQAAYMRAAADRIEATGKL